MKKYILCFMAGVIIGSMSCVVPVVINNIKKENRSENNQLLDAYLEIDRVLYVSADNKFEHGDFQGALNDMKNREIIRKTLRAGKKPSKAKEDETVTCLTKLVSLNEKIKRNPDDYKLYYERAKLQNKPKFSMFQEDEQSFCSDFKSAVKDFSKVIELKPDFKEVYEKRADAILQSMNNLRYKLSEEEKYEKLFNENFQMVISDYEKAVELNGASKPLRLKLAGAYLSAGQYEKALETFEKYPQEKEFGYSHFYGKALCYYKLNDYEKVIENLDLFLEHNPNLCTTISEKCLPSINGKKAYYRVRAGANWKLRRYKEWLKDVKRSF